MSDAFGFACSTMMGPLGATVRPGGVEFAVSSIHAAAVEVCIYDQADLARETARARLVRDEEGVWRGWIRGIGAGTPYGLRAHGAWAPEHGLWFNPAKLLIDPHAKALEGRTQWHPLLQNLHADGGRDFRDSGPVAPKSVVIGDDFDWGDDAPPRTAWSDTVIYELHVRGFTKLHPGVPPELRGTFAGLGHPAAMDYLRELGITAVQLLPVHQHLDDGFLLERGLTNYWGYNTLAFLAPHGEYAAARDAQGRVDEFKTMVRALHRAGIEVILDVVFNHTAEGSEHGPMLSLRGLDNRGYYLLDENARTVNYTGCGNTVNAASPRALQLILASLRYWAREMRVDGFRFDLAATLGRRGAQFDRDAAFFQAIGADPLLSRLKLIAEPWDLGPHGYQVGGFPAPWREINGRYRDKVRRFWRGEEGAAASCAKRLCGSDDIYGVQLRPPQASVNLVTSHDGFTMRDLWSHDRKHNEANRENNQDGDQHNHSWNCGIEGDTDDPEILAARRGLARSCLATMFCSLGVPFVTMGDERWRTQRGNNNAYCQDNEISWLDWSSGSEAESMLRFSREIIRFRRETPGVRRRRHFSGGKDPFTQRPDVGWLDEGGGPMSRGAWHDPSRRFFGALLDMEEGGALLLLFNSGDTEVAFRLPKGEWEAVFDTALDDGFSVAGQRADGGVARACRPRSVACWRLRP